MLKTESLHDMQIDMTSVFSFLPSYFSIIVFANGKISKSISLFLSHIGPKRFWQIRLQDFKSNISLEQNDGTVYFFVCWYQKLRVDRKILGWVWSKMVVATMAIRWLDEWMDELSWFFACWCKFRIFKNYFNNFWVIEWASEWIDESRWFFEC